MKEEQERSEKEIICFNLLLEEVNQYHQARQIREYLHKKEQKAIQGFQEGRLNEELKQWLAWARGKADELDPIGGG